MPDNAYPELVNVIGFNTPNYSGLFLRGYSGQTSYHYGAVWHVSEGLGIVQGDAIRNIEGYHTIYGGIYEDVGGAMFAYGIGGRHLVAGVNNVGAVRFGVNASQTVPVAAENRPINTAVRYLIRAR